MPATRLKWSSLLNLTELEFIPEAPKVLAVTDELLQAISWLTAATKHDRRLLRCDENGALLVGDAWSNLEQVDFDELHPSASLPDTFADIKNNKGVLIATSTQIIMIDFYRESSGGFDRIYLPPNWLYWYPHKVYKVIVSNAPYAGGAANYVGVSAFN